MSACRGALLLGLAGFLAAGCTSTTRASLSAGTSDPSSPSTVSQSAQTAPPSPRTVPPRSASEALTTSTRAAPTRAPASTPNAPPVLSTDNVPRSTCAAATVRVLRGSAVSGREFAALQFTNAGTSSCVLVGYPTVTLLRAGVRVGTASRPSSTAPSRFRLRPGATAESRLNDFTSCSAPLSGSVRVVVPGSTQTAIRPAQLRACTLRVGPLGPPE